MHSCLMQDEPELGVGFSRKMSLNGDGGMLSIDHQNGRFSDDEHRANPGVGGSQQRRAFYRAAARGEIRVGGKDAGAARVCRPATTRQERTAALYRPDDGLEPGSGDAADRRVSGDGPSDRSTLPAN